jgi:DNA polymerase-3 subunit delta
MATVHVFDYLGKPDAYPVAPVCVLFGDESFLQRQALLRLRQAIAPDPDSTQSETFDGDGCEWRDVKDELSTFSLFGGKARRLVVVEQADDFVSAHRVHLEEYVDHPKATGVLVLEVTKWASNTRLYKALDKSGLQIECRPPEKPFGRRKVLDEARVLQWLAAWCRDCHDARLDREAACLLLDLVGPQFGILHQELSKLALFVGPGGKIGEGLVRDVVGGWRTKTIWEVVDAALDGNAAEALVQLDRMFQAGEYPLAIFAPMAVAMRRFATATRIYETGENRDPPFSLRDALVQAGVPNWPTLLDKSERQLKQLGRARAGALYRSLLELELALKGTHSAPDRARYALEHFVLRLSRLADPKARKEPARAKA